MRTASSDLHDDIAGGCTTLARLFKVTRTDGTVLRFTDLDRPVVFGGDTFRADITFDASAIFTSSILANAQSVTMTVMLSDGGITEDDLRLRKYDGAVGDIWIVNYEDTSHGVLKFYHGVFGQVVLSDKGMAQIEITPSGAALDGQAIGVEVFQATCRNSFGDALCGKDRGEVAFTVSATSGQTVTAAAFTQADNFWVQGFLTWSTGPNAGTTQTIRASDQSATTVDVITPTLHPIGVGDTGSVFRGCDKLPATCKDTHANFAKFRAEPNVPDPSMLPNTPVSRSA